MATETIATWVADRLADGERAEPHKGPDQRGALDPPDRPGAIRTDPRGQPTDERDVHVLQPAVATWRALDGGDWAATRTPATVWP